MNPREVWAEASRRLKQMIYEERVDTFKQAGILTPTGRVAKPYRGVFVRKVPK